MSSRSRRPRSLPKQAAVPTRKRSAADLAHYATDLERELARARAALEQQKREFEEESANFPQVLARLAHSERTLGQTKTKLIAAEEAAALASKQVVALRARAQEADARVQELSDIERDLRTELGSLRDALAAALEREPSFQRVEQELRAEVAELRTTLEASQRERSELDAMQTALSQANQARDELVGALGAIELLAQRIARISREPQALRTQLPPENSTIPKPDGDHSTMKPVSVVATQEAPRSLRRVTPEIIVDGVPLAR